MGKESVTELVPSAEADSFLVHFRSPGTTVPGFHMSQLSGWSIDLFSGLHPSLSFVTDSETTPFPLQPNPQNPPARNCQGCPFGLKCGDVPSLKCQGCR